MFGVDARVSETNKEGTTRLWLCPRTWAGVQLCSAPIRWKGGDCARIKFFSGRKNAGDFYQHFAAWAGPRIREALVERPAPKGWESGPGGVDFEEGGGSLRWGWGTIKFSSPCGTTPTPQSNGAFVVGKAFGMIWAKKTSKKERKKFCLFFLKDRTMQTWLKHWHLAPFPEKLWW